MVMFDHAWSDLVMFNQVGEDRKYNEFGPKREYRKYGEFRDHMKIWDEMENMEYRENGGNRYILKIRGILNLRNRRDNCPNLIVSSFILTLI